MRPRVALASLALLVLFALPAPAGYMDCFPGKWVQRPDPKDSRCIIEWDTSCMWCNVEIFLNQ